jgi:predicted dehydrogenase
MLARIHGTEGFIEVYGPCPSEPVGFTIYENYDGEPGARRRHKAEVKSYNYTVLGRGYQFEADNAALDVLAGRMESAVMPWSETIRIMEVMDEIRRQGGTRYSADE